MGTREGQQDSVPIPVVQDSNWLDSPNNGEGLAVEKPARCTE